MKKQDYVSASHLYNKNRDLFNTPKEKPRRSSELDELAGYLNGNFATRMTEAKNELVSIVHHITDSAYWKQIELTISVGGQLLVEYESQPLLLNLVGRIHRFGCCPAPVPVTLKNSSPETPADVMLTGVRRPPGLGASPKKSLSNYLYLS